MTEDLRDTTRRTAARLFHTLRGGVGFELWKQFDKDLARELSMFFTGKLYSREVIPQRDREMCAGAAGPLSGGGAGPRHTGPRRVEKHIVRGLTSGTLPS